MITFSWAILRAIREQERLDEPFLRLALGTLLLQTYEPMLGGLYRISQELVIYLERLGDKTSLIDFVSQAMTRAGSLHHSHASPGLSGQVSTGVGNIAEYMSQALRTGVWGICASIVELLFIVIRYLLSIGREVLWHLILVFLPLVLGLLPSTPRLAILMTLGALELCLWPPALTVIDIVTSIVARSRSLQTGDLGLSVLAVELLAVLLAIAVIPLCHKIVSGSLGQLDPVQQIAKSTIRPAKVFFSN